MLWLSQMVFVSPTKLRRSCRCFSSPQNTSDKQCSVIQVASAFWDSQIATKLATSQIYYWEMLLNAILALFFFCHKSGFNKLYFLLFFLLHFKKYQLFIINCCHDQGTVPITEAERSKIVNMGDYLLQLQTKYKYSVHTFLWKMNKEQDKGNSFNLIYKEIKLV